jgi:hypothetical protein
MMRAALEHWRRRAGAPRGRGPQDPELGPKRPGSVGIEPDPTGGLGQVPIRGKPPWQAELGRRGSKSLTLHGKEGVRGSSPRVGSQEDRPTRAPAWPV